MGLYLARRLIRALLVLLGVSVVVFGLLQLSGDPATLLLGLNATPEEVARLRRLMRLDDPVIVQYLRFLGSAVRLDFGLSLRSDEPALALVLERLPATFQLAALGMGLSLVVAFPLGIVGAVKRGRLADQLAVLVGVLGQSVPGFWLGIILILVFAVNLRWLPPGGRDSWDSAILPAVTVAAFFMARATRMIRSAMLEVLSQDYIRTAWAKGLSSSHVLLRHALKNAMIPVVTLIGLDLGTLLGGAVITETIFSWPGVGLLAYKAIQGRDYPVVQAVVFVVASGYVLINLLVDLTYAYLNPRIRYG